MSCDCCKKDMNDLVYADLPCACGRWFCFECSKDWDYPIEEGELLYCPYCTDEEEKRWKDRINPYEALIWLICEGDNQYHTQYGKRITGIRELYTLRDMLRFYEGDL